MAADQEAHGSDLTAAGRWRRPPRGLWAVKLALMLGLWVTGLLLLFVDLPTLTLGRDLAFLLLLALALPAAKLVSRTVALVGLASAALLLVFYDEPDVLLDAAERALVFVIFLPALLIMRETMQRAPEARAAEAAFDTLGPGRRIAGLTIGSHLLAAVLIIGALPIIRPFLARQVEPALKLELTLAAMRGFGLCVLWSPFTVGMAFVLTAKPTVAITDVLMLGLPTTAVALAAAVFVDRGWKGIQAALPALLAFRSLAVPIVVIVVLVVLLASTTPLSTLEAVALSVPLLCAVRLAALPGTPVRAALLATAGDLPRLGDELLMFTGAVLIGELIRSAGLAAAAAELLVLDVWPPALVPALGFALAAPLAVLGLHPIVAGTLLFALLSPIEAQLPDLFEVQMVLFAWMAGAMTSYASLSVVAASSLFEVPLRRLTLSVNLVFVVGLGLCLAAFQGLWLWLA